MSQPASLHACIKAALWGVLVRGPILAISVVYVVYLIRHGVYSSTTFFEFLEMRVFNSSFIPKLVMLWLMMFCAAVLYPYFRTRNPTYIKKQAAYEKWKAEKEAAKQKADEQRQSQD
jgi:hypothetical protein